MSNTDRRAFLQKAITGTMLAISIPQILAEASDKKNKKISLTKDAVILFQGDSITDAGRNREALEPNSSKGFGNGYAMIAGSKLLHEHADKNLSIYNRGISGNKVYQLAERWDADCLNLKPTVLSILIGVNDFWHMKNGNYNGTIETYRNDFKALLERTRKQLPDIRIIIGEPFAVKGLKAVDDTWFPAFQEYQTAARDLAKNFDAILIPYQEIFNKALNVAPPVYWTHDGVHPSLAGNQLMAHAWLNVVKG
jgi:lysophospholipase L1-like esterase